MTSSFIPRTPVTEEQVRANLIRHLQSLLDSSADIAHEIASLTPGKGYETVIEGADLGWPHLSISVRVDKVG